MKKITLLAFIAFVLISCADKHSVKISGTFADMSKQTVYFEKRGASRIFLLDSVKLDDNGKFSVTLNVQNAEPAFISIRNNKGRQLAILLAENGEKINVNYAANRLEIEGSEGSNSLSVLNNRMEKTMAKIDSLSKIINSNDVSDEDKVQASTLLSKTYVDQKRKSISFVVENPKSYAAVYALYQQFPDGTKLFGKIDDFLFFKAVADSLSAKYPNAEYVKLVKRDYENLRKAVDLNNKLTENPIKEIGFPDISLPNQLSQRVALSSLEGKVVLVSFWASTLPNSQLANRELLDLYAKYNGKGFEIYQISLDTDRNAWIRAIDLQSLPWVSVCDFSGTNCIAISTYNVQQVPSNFLISKKGEIVARDLFGDKLDKKIAEIINN